MNKDQIKEMTDVIMSAIKGCSDTTSLRDKIDVGLSYYWDDKIAIVWTIEDVIKRAEALSIPISKDDAQIILQGLLLDHDRYDGISINTIDQAINYYDESNEV